MGNRRPIRSEMLLIRSTRPPSPLVRPASSSRTRAHAGGPPSQSGTPVRGPVRRHSTWALRAGRYPKPARCAPVSPLLSRHDRTLRGPLADAGPPGRAPLHRRGGGKPELRRRYYISLGAACVLSCRLFRGETARGETRGSIRAAHYF
jgi:hypothetical protein